jgi:hypothetical protein
MQVKSYLLLRNKFNRYNMHPSPRKQKINFIRDEVNNRFNRRYLILPAGSWSLILTLFNTLLYRNSKQSFKFIIGFS